MIIIGAACLVILVICGAIIRPVPEGYVEYKRAQDSGAGDQPNEDADAPSRVVKDLNRGQMVKTSMFYVAAVTFAFGLTSGMMVISQCTQIMGSTFGLSMTRAALYASLLS